MLNTISSYLPRPFREIITGLKDFKQGVRVEKRIMELDAKINEKSQILQPARSVEEERQPIEILQGISEDADKASLQAEKFLLSKDPVRITTKNLTKAVVRLSIVAAGVFLGYLAKTGHLSTKDLAIFTVATPFLSVPATLLGLGGLAYQTGIDAIVSGCANKSLATLAKGLVVGVIGYEILEFHDFLPWGYVEKSMKESNVCKFCAQWFAN